MSTQRLAAAALLDTLQRWRRTGQLRALDVAFARLLHELHPEAPARLLLAGALAAQMEGRGHACIEMAQWTTALAAETSAWPAASARELAAWLPQDWAAECAAWAGSPLVAMQGPGGEDAADATPCAPGVGGSTPPSPLVLHRGRLYLRRYWTWESRVAAQVRSRTRSEAAADGVIDAAEARRWLDRLFPPTASSSSSTSRKHAESAPDATIDWQKLACALALHGRFTVITGGPGTGKTYTAARLLVLLQALHRGAHPLRVALAAPTGKAAARLRQAIDAALAALRPTIERDFFAHDPSAAPGPARTLHALLGARAGTHRLRHDASQPLEVDVLFVDEASMVHLEMMAALLDALPRGARLVLLGDKDQLASVEAGAVLGDLCAGADAGGCSAATRERVRALTGITLPARYLAADDGSADALAQHIAMLRTSHRFGGAIGALAAAVNRGDAAGVLEQLGASADVVDEAVAHDAAAHEPAALRTLAVEGRAGAAGYRACFERLRARPADADAFAGWARAVLTDFDRLRVLCAVRAGPHGVHEVNAAIEQALAEARLLPARRGQWYEGRPVMVTRNDAALGVFNGDIGITLAPPRGQAAAGAAAQPLRVYFLEAGALRSVSTSRLADVETAFALTVHKSQGSEFEHVLLVLPRDDVPVLTRELLYTAITRARTAFTLAAADLALVQRAVLRLTSRSSGLRTLLAG